MTADPRAMWLEDIPSSLTTVLPPRPRVHLPDQGMTSDVACLVGANRTVVVKRCNHPVYRNWLRREYDVLCAVRDTRLQVPVALGLAERATKTGLEVWIVMTALPGATVWQTLARADGHTRTALLAALGTNLRALHAVPVPPRFADQTPWLNRKLDEAEANLEWCDGTRELLEALRRTMPVPVTETLIHGDLALDNVLVDDEGRMGFLDWSAGDSGDRRYDLALALDAAAECALTESELDTFFSAYGNQPLEPATRRWFVDLCEFF